MLSSRCGCGLGIVPKGAGVASVFNRAFFFLEVNFCPLLGVSTVVITGTGELDAKAASSEADRAVDGDNDSTAAAADIDLDRRCLILDGRIIIHDGGVVHVRIAKVA